MATASKGENIGLRRAGTVAVLLAAAVVAGAAAARADTVSAIEDHYVTFLDEEVAGEDAGYGDWVEETDWTEDPGDDGWIKDEWTDEEYLADWDEQIAWSGIPIDEEHILYMTSDWVKRGPGDDRTPAPVPLPGAGLLLLGGLAGLAAVRRRRRD